MINLPLFIVYEEKEQIFEVGRINPLKVGSEGETNHYGG